MLMKTKGLPVEGEADKLFGTYEEYLEWLNTHQDQSMVGGSPVHCVLAHYLAARHRVDSMYVSVGLASATVFGTWKRYGLMPPWATEERRQFDTFAVGKCGVTAGQYLKSRGR